MRCISYLYSKDFADATIWDTCEIDLTFVPMRPPLAVDKFVSLPYLKCSASRLTFLRPFPRVSQEWILDAHWSCCVCASSFGNSLPFPLTPQIISSPEHHFPHKLPGCQFFSLLLYLAKWAIQKQQLKYFSAWGRYTWQHFDVTLPRIFAV